MRNPLTSSASASLGLLLARLPIGVIFVWAGFFKLAKIGLKEFVEKSAGAIPHFLPTAVGRGYLYALPFVEMLVGVMIVLGFFTRLAGLISSLILISIMIAVTGAKGEPGALFSTNVFYLAITLMLLFTGPGGFALDRLCGKCGGAKSPS